MEIDKIIKEAELAEQEVVELTSSLVKFNTAHPEGYTDECVAYVAEYFDKQGITTEIHAKDPRKPNIVARIEGESDRTILWLGHLDVVPEGMPEFWTYPAYSGTVKDGNVYGRGSSDMKGACAAAMTAARILSQLSDPLPNNVEFWFSSDEEIGGGVGAKWLAESGKLEGDICVIGDGKGGGLKMPCVNIGCKGSASARLISTGKAAHGSTPFLGDNALRKLIDVIPFVEKIGNFKLEYPKELNEPVESSIKHFKTIQQLTPEQEKAADRLFDYPTVSCNLLNAGIKGNVVPDYAEATFDIRLTPGSDPMKVKSQIEKLVGDANVPGVEVEVRVMPYVGYYESPHSPFAMQLAETVEKVTGKKPFHRLVQGSTDGVSVSRIAGITSLGYGITMAGQAHQPDERITIENLVLGVKIYSAFPIIYRG
ncbi:MAG TPA: M20 family metallopeptidase [Spirochaetia bacterium]|nr:M20 family metallopeptidase [Spirochaetia bacterium]